MAIGTTAAIMGGVALAGSGLQIAQGMRQEREANSALNDFERQDLENVYSDMPISLLGSNLRREDASQTTANLTEAARGSGIRGVFGALPRIQASSNQAARVNQLDVDDQVMRRNFAIAGDEGRIQGIQENRDNQDLAGIGQLMSVGQQNQQSGISGAFNSAGLIGSGFTGKTGGEETPQTQSVGVGTLNQQPRAIMAPMMAPMGSMMPGMPSGSSIGSRNFLADYNKLQEDQRFFSELSGQFGV
jgi:hypothetical protein